MDIWTILLAKIQLRILQHRARRLIQDPQPLQTLLVILVRILEPPSVRMLLQLAVENEIRPQITKQPQRSLEDLAIISVKEKIVQKKSRKRKKILF